MAVHYLSARDNRFTVQKGFFDIAPQGPLDDPPHLRIRTDLFDHPALEVESPRRDKGCVMSIVSLYELQPEGPRLRAREIVTERNNIPMGALRIGPQVDLYGNVIAGKKGKAFKVHYHGTTEGDVDWTPGPDGVELLEFRHSTSFNFVNHANGVAFWDKATKTAEANVEDWKVAKRPSLIDA